MSRSDSRSSPAKETEIIFKILLEGKKLQLPLHPGSEGTGKSKEKESRKTGF